MTSNQRKQLMSKRVRYCAVVLVPAMSGIAPADAETEVCSRGVADALSSFPESIMHVGVLNEVRKLGLVPYRHERQKSRILLA